MSLDLDYRELLFEDKFIISRLEQEFTSLSCLTVRINLKTWICLLLEKFVAKKLNDYVELEPCLDDDQMDLGESNSSKSDTDNNTNIVWTLNDENETKYYVSRPLTQSLLHSLVSD